MQVYPANREPGGFILFRSFAATTCARKDWTSRAMDHSRTQIGTDSGNARNQPGFGAALLPIMASVFIAFIVIGLAIPVLPLHVHQGLGFGTFLVGLVAGSQFAAAILSRVWAGRDADVRGSKHAVVAGLVIAAIAGLLYFVSLAFFNRPAISVVILLFGRALLGVGESFIITGAQTWGLALLGVLNTSKVLAWIGSAMFGAFALGAPLGTAIYGMYGFPAIALATTLLPIITLLFVAPLERAPIVARAQASLMKVMGVVWVPGVASALSSIGFGAITAFSALLFVARGWAAWPAFTAFATAFILTRFLFGHVADRFGGAKVALTCAGIEAVGLALIWLSPWLGLALLGAALTGIGYSLVYPGFGVEAVRKVPAQSRGLAMGAYTAFLDVALGFGTPALGLVADMMGLGAAFAVSMLAALCAASIAAALLFSLRSQRAASAFACSRAHV
jgi:MFS family permease